MGLLYRLLLLCWIPFLTAWVQDPVEAVICMQQEKKGLVVAFLKSKECPWSEKLRTELLNVPEWKEKVEKEAVLLQIEASHPDAQHLKDLFGIKSIPSVVALDGEGETVDVFFFEDESPLKAASHLVEKFRVLRKIKQLLERPKDITKTTFDALYAKATPFYQEQLKTLYGGKWKE